MANNFSRHCYSLFVDPKENCSKNLSSDFLLFFLESSFLLEYFISWWMLLTYLFLFGLFSLQTQDMLVSLSTLLRGTTYEKLKWTFTLYDLNKDGYITKQEVLNVIIAVHELMGIHGSPPVRPTTSKTFST